MNKMMALALLLVVSVIPTAHAGPPVCTVISIDQAHGVVTARDAKDVTFSFRGNAATVRSLKVGQTLDARFIRQAEGTVARTGGGRADTGDCLCGKTRDGQCWCTGGPETECPCSEVPGGGTGPGEPGVRSRQSVPRR